MLYHITDRGNNRKEIFQDDKDRKRLLGYFKEAVERFRLRIHAFCLMPNHYHLEVETPFGNISRAMQWIKTTYAFNYNRRYNRSGHLFQGRFKAILLEKESHLLELSRYIHLNPVRGGLVKSPEEYVWSSYRDYIGMRGRRIWLETDWLLAQYGGYRRIAESEYRRFVEEGIERKLVNPMKGAVAGIALGSEEFADWVLKLLQKRGIGAHAVTNHKYIHNTSMRDINRKVGRALNVSEVSICQRGRHGTEAREIAIYLAHKYCDETNVSLGRVFGGICGTNISYIASKVKEKIGQDRKIKRLVERIEENLFSDA
ncbi:MAG: transposase [Gemmatimonadota bacterium]|nr:MAG: transposase [Gemmatimonadota bacterium]